MRGNRAATGNHGAQATGRRQGISHLAIGQQPRLAEILRQAQGDTRPGRDQRHPIERLADDHQIIVRHGIHDGEVAAFGLQFGKAILDGLRPLGNHVEVDQAHLALDLGLQHLDQIGVGHRRQRVIFHPGIGKQDVANKEMPLVDGAAIDREGRTGDGELAAQCLHQRLAHRADIALGRGIEGRAVFEVELTATCSLQPLERRQRFGDGFFHRIGTRFKRDHHGIDIIADRFLGNADHLYRAHTSFHQHSGEVGAASEVVGNATKYEAHK